VDGVKDELRSEGTQSIISSKLGENENYVMKIKDIKIGNK